jgi:TolA-binding protein
VVVLRERVARLEKRLADVDARLGLLLARAGEQPAGARPALRFDAPRGEQRAVDLGPPAGAADGASVDIERGGGDLPPIVDTGAAFVDEGGGEVDGGGGGSGADSDDGAEAPRLVLRGTPSPPAPDDGDPLANMPTARALYEWAQTRRKEGRLLEAIAAFEDVVGRFPRDDLADNALYWTGQCHQTRGDHKLALSVWQKLPLRFPRSAKIPDALFGMGQSHEALGEPALALVLYDEVVQSYPRAEKREDARRAVARLRPGR